MIQRKQTLFLLFSTIASFLTLKFPFYTGNIIENNLKVYKVLDARFTILITILTVAVGVAALITIFLYNDRKKQMLITSLSCIISMAVIALYYVQTKTFVDGAFSFTAILSLLIPVLLIMSIVGIRNDEKLIKSVDRLR